VDALCGSTLMIGLDELKEEGLLAKSDLPKKIAIGTVDYPQVQFHPLHMEALLVIIKRTLFVAAC